MYIGNAYFIETFGNDKKYLNEAFKIFKEDVKGTLEVDKIADFIVLDRDLFEIDSLLIKDTNVLKTFKDGKCIYSRGDQFE